MAAGDGNVLTLADARAHLRVDDNAEDQYISGLVLAAQTIVEDEMGRPMLGEKGWPEVAAIPPNVVHAVRLVLAELYLKREGGDLNLWFVSALVGRYTSVSVG